MLLRKIPRGPGALIAALATALGVSLAAFFFVLLAPAAGAITGGQDSASLDGQVQFYVAAGPGLGDPVEYRCAGTLISTEWVLTAKHCITNTGATPANSGVLVGDRQLGQGEPHALESIHLETSTDAALLELEDPVSNPSNVVGYVGDSTPTVNQNVAIRGWGSPPGTPPRPVLQVATMRTVDTDWSSGGGGDRLLFDDIGQGVVDEGDSGAGVYAGSGIHGVVSGGDGYMFATAVPTEDIAGWIEQTSGVPPSSAAPDTSASASAGAEEEPTEETAPEETVLEEPEQTEPEGEAVDSLDPAPEETEQEQPAPLEDGELEDLLSGIDAVSLDSDEYAQELRRVVSERYPGYNVMVIQQETYDQPENYDEPENIQGVAMGFSTDISPYNNGLVGAKTWDVWVFESGTFTNTGDLGYKNWVFTGNFERSGEDLETATFEPIGE